MSGEARWFIHYNDGSLSNRIEQHEFSLICPLYGVKLREESKYFIRIFAARLYAKKCKTCVCTHQPELPHARAAGIGWNHRFDDV